MKKDQVDNLIACLSDYAEEWERLDEDLEDMGIDPQDAELREELKSRPEWAMWMEASGEVTGEPELEQEWKEFLISYFGE